MFSIHHTNTFEKTNFKEIEYSRVGYERSCGRLRQPNLYIKKEKSSCLKFWADSWLLAIYLINSTLFMHQTHSNTTWPFNLPTKFKGEDFYQPIRVRVINVKVALILLRGLGLPIIFGSETGSSWETYFILLLCSWMSVSDWSGHCETDPESSVRPRSRVHSLQSLCLSTSGHTPRLTSQLFGPLLKKLSQFMHPQTHDHAHHIILLAAKKQL